MSANFNSVGVAKQLDRRPDPDETVTPDNCTDPKALARLLTRLLRSVTRLERKWAPRRLDFEDTPVGFDGVTKYNLQHNFAGRVRWFVVDWVGDTSAVPMLARDSSSTADTLVLRSFASGLATVRVEPAG